MLKILFYIKLFFHDFKYNLFTGYSIKQDNNFKNYLWEFLKTDNSVFTEKEKDNIKQFLIK